MPTGTDRRLLPALSLFAILGSVGPCLADGAHDRTNQADVAFVANKPERSPYQLMLTDPNVYRVRVKPEYRLAASAADLPEDAPFASEVVAAANAFALEPALLHAMITVESNHNPGALSPRGAMGLMQLMPDTSHRFDVADPWHPGQNIRGGARYLSDLLVMFDNDLSLALAAYNAGEQAVMRHGRRVPPYPETRNYVSRVLAIYREHSPVGRTTTQPARNRARQM